MAGRWVTFDCYGTLVDWWTGMGCAAEAAAGERGPQVLAAYHPHEFMLETEWPIRPYRDILREGLRRAAADVGARLTGDGDEAFVRAWTRMPVFDDVAPATTGREAPSTAIAYGTSMFEPPRYVQKMSAVPAGFTFATYASLPPPSIGCTGVPAVGKFVEETRPA